MGSKFAGFSSPVTNFGSRLLREVEILLFKLSRRGRTETERHERIPTKKWRRKNPAPSSTPYDSRDAVKREEN
jgi:hypothetical protein